MPKTHIFYEVGADITWSQADLDYDLISLYATAAWAITLPDAYEGAATYVTIDADSGSEAITFKHPDTSTLIILPTGSSTLLYSYSDVDGIPAWGCEYPWPVAPGATQTYAITNVTTDRAYDANATTTDELADTLGTLIGDLRAKGIVA